MDNIKEAVFEGLLAAIEYKQKTEVKPTTPVLMGKMIVEFYDLISSMMTREQLEQALSTAMYPVFVEGLPSELTLNEVIKLGRESIKFNMKGALEENQMTLISEKMEPRLTLSSLIYYSPLSGESMSKFMSANLSWYPLERQVKVIDIWNLTIQQASSTQYGKYSEFTMRSRVIESIKVLGLDEYLPTENLADYDSTNLIYIFKIALLKSNCHPIEVIDQLSQLSWYSKDYFDCGKTRICRAVVNGYRESNDGDNFPEDILEGLVGIIVKLLKPATKLELMEMYPIDVHFNERSIKDDKYYLEYYKSLLLQARSSKRLYKRVLLDVFTCLIKHTNTTAGMIEMHMNHFLDAREKEAAPT